MKHLLTFLLLMCSYVLCGAQATSLTVDNQTPGWLSSKINYGDQQTVENLTVTGYINGSDLKFIHELNTKRNLQGIIDLSNSSIISGGDAYKDNYEVREDLTISLRMFAMENRVRKIILPKSTTTILYDRRYGTFGNIDSLIVDCPEVQSVGGFIEYDWVNYLYLCEGITSVDFAYGIGGSDNQVVVLPSSINKVDTYRAFVKGTIWSSILDPSQISGSGNISSGTIYVPAGTTDLYKKSRFRNLQIIENIYPEEIEFEVSNKNIYVGDEFQMRFSILPSNSIHNDLYWQSSDTSIADVDSTGKITGHSFGQSTITASTINDIVASCNINVYEHVASITLPESITLNISENKKLFAEINPVGKTFSDVIWRSSDEKIVSVDRNGNVTGVSKGSCSVSAITVDGGHMAECIISVVQPVESVSVMPKYSNLKVGEDVTLTVTILPADANDKSIIWSSSEVSIAKVSDEGKVLAISPGSAKIFAYSSNNLEISDFCEVTIIQPATGITLDKSEVEVIEDESIQLNATVLPENASNKKVNWTSSDVSIAMVSPDGTVYAIKPGQATIMATTEDGGFVALCKITVKAKEVIASAIRLSNTTETIAVGETLQLNAVLEPDNVTNKNISWTSTNTDVATVNADGLVKAESEGSTQIIATTTDGSNLSAICDITVERQFVGITQIKISPSDARIVVGQSLTLDAIITPSDASSPNVLWSSTNTSVATVSQNGKVDAVAEGEAIIIASTQDGSNLSATCNISVYNEAGIESILENKNANVKIFDLNGLLVYEGLYGDTRIAPGFYIIVYNGRRYKAMIN